MTSDNLLCGAAAMIVVLLTACSTGPDSTDASADITHDGLATHDTLVDATHHIDTNVPPSDQCKPIPAVTRTTARLMVDPESGNLRDSHGRDVIFRGVNAGGRSKWAPFVPFPIEAGDPLDVFKRKSDAYFSRLNYWGLDAVRLVFSWEAFEPAPGVVDETYLARYTTMIDSAWEHGVSVVVDIHQDIYASPFCGDGFPPWTLPEDNQGPPLHDCPRWFMKYLFDADVRAAFDRFWSDETGVRTAFATMWTRLAHHLKDHPGIMAFEVLNEPGWGNNNDVEDFKATTLLTFYEEMTDVLRAVTPNMLIVYDAVGIDAVNPSAGHHRPDRPNLLYGPHVYDAGLLAGGAWTGGEPDAMLDSLLAFQQSTQTPIMIGEFGVTHGAPGADTWLRKTMEGIDTRRFSATLWEYSHNEELWNHEDLSIIDADGSERIVLDTYVRPWLRAVAGKLPRFEWSMETGGSATWVAETGTTELVLPHRLFPNGPQHLRISGDGVCHTWDAEQGELRVTAPEGTPVTVHFTSEPEGR